MTLDPTQPDADVPPRKVYIEITSECNLDCAMCIRQSWHGTSERMAPELYREVLDQLRATGTVQTVNLSGYGEPMGHPRFLDYAADAKAAGFAVEAITNGTLLDAAAVDGLIDAGVDRLCVSVDGLSATASEPFHGATFPAVADALHRLHDRRRSRATAAPYTTVVFVAGKRNLADLAELRRRAVALGISEILVTNLIPHTPALAEETLYDQPGTVSRARATTPYNPVVDLPILDAAPAVGRVVQQLRSLGTHVRVGGRDIAGAGPRCRFVTEGRLAVRHDGRVSPCLPLLYAHTYYFRGRAKAVEPYHPGRLGERALAEIWDDAEYTDFRRRVQEFSFSPCIDCGGCELRDTNAEDCTGEQAPRCGECLWAAGLVQCP